MNNPAASAAIFSSSFQRIAIFNAIFLFSFFNLLILFSSRLLKRTIFSLPERFSNRLSFKIKSQFSFARFMIANFSESEVLGDISTQISFNIIHLEFSQIDYFNLILITPLINYCPILFCFWFFLLKSLE